MRWAALLVLLPVTPVALASCDDSGINPVPGPAIGYATGSRLRAKVRSGAPGARMRLGWHDNKLDVDCAFATAEDGLLRCVPTGAEIVFLDQLCTQPIAVANPACGSAPPAFASTTAFSPDSCEGLRQAFRVRDEISLADRHIYVSAGAAGGCLKATELDPAAKAYTLEPVDPSELVQGTSSRSKKTERLGLEVIVGSDGAQQVSGVYDVASKQRCFSIAGAIGGGQDRCIPDAVSWATYAADPQCSTRVAYQIHPTDACPRASVVVAYGFEGCDPKANYFTPAGSLSIDNVFSGTSPVCTSLRKQPSLYGELVRDHVFYRIGDAIDATSFPVLKSQTTGVGRLAVPVLAGEDATTLVPARNDFFFDTTLGVLCRAYTFPGGELRCVPRDAVPIVTPAYSDDGCTKEVVSVALSVCGTTPAYAVRAAESDGCSRDLGASQVLRLGPSVSLDAYYVVDDTGACAKTLRAGDFAPIVGEIPVKQLEVIVETIE